MRRSVRDPGLRAEIVERRALILPVGHVRAASALVAHRGGWVVAQDDVLAAAVITELDATLVLLPTEPDGMRSFDARLGTKHRKPDLEAAVVLPDGRLVLLGSGSTAMRERVYAIRDDEVTVVTASELYAALREALGPAIALNIEGAVATGDVLRLLQRGNGAGGVNAELRIPLAWLAERLGHLDHPRPPPPVEVRRWALGTLGGLPLSFTDGVGIGPEAWVYAAAAEDSPNTVDDGAVTGSAFGVVSGGDARWTPIVDRDGRVVPLKAEGIAPGTAPGEWWVSTDADDPDAPAELIRLAVTGRLAPRTATVARSPTRPRQ
ncbi:MAG: hypothetical protein ABMB14_02290 [Myxococcota bacterium]